MKRVLVIGSQGHAASVAGILERSGYCIAGLLDRFRAMGDEAYGYRVLGSDEDIHNLCSSLELNDVVVAVGDNLQRAECVARAREKVPGLKFPAVIDPSAVIGRNVTIGEGSVIMPGTVVNAEAKVGSFCIVNTGATLDHESVVEDYASLAPGVTIGGRARIGAFSAVCLGASVIHKVHVGPHTIVGAGATVLSNIPEFVVAYGTPARAVRTRTAGEPYL